MGSNFDRHWSSGSLQALPSKSKEPKTKWRWRLEPLRDKNTRRRTAKNLRYPWSCCHQTMLKERCWLRHHQSLGWCRHRRQMSHRYQYQCRWRRWWYLSTKLRRESSSTRPRSWCKPFSMHRPDPAPLELRVSSHGYIIERLWKEFKEGWLKPSDYQSADTLFYAVDRICANIGKELFMNFSEFNF